jgi:hypothetical protein
MFVKAIEKAKKYTRPIHTITKSYKSNDILPGAATLFFVNDKGYAITCKHVIELLVQSENINKNYSSFKSERDKLPQDVKLKKNIKGLMLKYTIDDKTTIQLKNTFMNCVDEMSGFTWHVHPTYDLAILKFNDFGKLMCNEFAVFKKDSNEIQQGKFLCRLGFPFPEFTNYTYNDQIDEIEWTKTGVNASPIFPIEGMVTRFLGDGKGGKYGLELSIPGLRGQSGGPLFDTDGIVCGMQSRTKHLHLGFDLENHEIITKGQRKKVSDYSFIHLGECIHADVIKDFLRQHKVDFTEQ